MKSERTSQTPTTSSTSNSTMTNLRTKCIPPTERSQRLHKMFLREMFSQETLQQRTLSIVHAFTRTTSYAAQSSLGFTYRNQSLHDRHPSTIPQTTTTPPHPSAPPKSNFHLNFPEVYPKLDLKRSNASCRAVWATLTDVQCHEGIWSRGWDSGIPHPATGDSETEGLDIEKMVPLICGEVSPLRTMCHSNLELAKGLLDADCVGENAFAFEGYEGNFNTSLL